MKSSTALILALAIMVAVTSAQNATNVTNSTSTSANVYCGNANGTGCTSWIGASACCAYFNGSSTNSSGAVKYYNTSFCATRAIVNTFSGNYSLPGTNYKGTL